MAWSLIQFTMSSIETVLTQTNVPTVIEGGVCIATFATVLTWIEQLARFCRDIAIGAHHSSIGAIGWNKRIRYVWHCNADERYRTRGQPLSLMTYPLKLMLRHSFPMVHWIARDSLKLMLRHSSSIVHSIEHDQLTLMLPHSLSIAYWIERDSLTRSSLNNSRSMMRDWPMSCYLT